MKWTQLKPRFTFAIVMGAGAAIFLSLLLSNGQNSPFNGVPESPVIVTTGTVQPGETLATLLKNQSLDPVYIYPVQKTLSEEFNLRRMHPNDEFELVTSTDGVFKTFTYRVDPIHFYAVNRSSEGVYSVSKGEKKTIWIEKYVTCTVTDNLYTDLLRQGYDERFVANLVADLADNIFAWRIDFFTEQRPGDHLEVLLEQEFKVGSDKPLWGGRGRIYMASYNGKGTKKDENLAFRYHAPNEKQADYFDEEGQAVRKAFLRAPFTHGSFRISSYFNPRRFHPIKRVYRPHHGTDYAAPTGTRIAAVGRGQVVRAGWHGGYGKCVDIRHSGKYTSRYGHLSQIAVKPGQMVEQGQFIGKVGSTGQSTGPHLHFEMHVDGVQRNFLRLNFPAAKSVSAPHLDAYFAVRDSLLERIRRSRDTASIGSDKT